MQKKNLGALKQGYVSLHPHHHHHQHQHHHLSSCLDGFPAENMNFPAIPFWKKRSAKNIYDLPSFFSLAIVSLSFSMLGSPSFHPATGAWRAPGCVAFMWILCKINGTQLLVQQMGSTIGDLNVDFSWVLKGWSNPLGNRISWVSYGFSNKIRN